MRVRVIRWTDPTSSLVNLRVQRWCAGQWERVLDFELNQVEQANEFAMKLSMSKRVPTELAVFDEGQKVDISFEPLLMAGNGEVMKISESAP